MKPESTGIMGSFEGIAPSVFSAMGNIFWRSCCHPHAKLNRLDKARPLGLLGYQWKRTPCKPLAY